MNRPRLLVSVRNAAEVSDAAEADLLDLKEPSRGSLGMASPEMFDAVFQAVQRLPAKSRPPLSAALGEVIDWETPAELNPQIAYASYGQRKVTQQESTEITAVIRKRTKRRITVIERDPNGLVRVWLYPEGNEAMTYIVERRGNGWKIVSGDKAIFD